MNNGRGEQSAKIGDQTLKAMIALGGEEIRNALYPTSNVAQHSTEPGMYGDRSYGDVAHDRMAQSDPQRSSLLAEKIKQAEPARDVREREPQTLTLE